MCDIPTLCSIQYFVAWSNISDQHGMIRFCGSFRTPSGSDAASSTRKHVFVIPSEVENGAAREAATWTERPKAERAGGERIKSLAFFRFRTSPTDSKRCLDSARHDN